MVYYADISEVWETNYKIPKIKDRFRNNTYLWEQKEPEKIVEPVQVQEVPVEPVVLQEPAMNLDSSISSEYMNVTLKNNNVCERLKEYSEDYRSSYIESLIENDLEDDYEEYKLFFKILAVVLFIELIKLLVSPLIRRG